VLQKANEAVNRDLLGEAVNDLVNRVEDWKKHRVDQFGDLLLHGVYTVVTGKGDQEKDVSFSVQSTSTCAWLLTGSLLVRDLSLPMHPALLQGDPAGEEQR
jgi:hypothetical protein